jgi:hypothetical protein
VAFERDPVSELFDQAARTLLARAYASPGHWVMTRLINPDPAQRAYAGSLGIDVYGTDQWGRDRWAAAFIRAVYYQHKHAGAGGRPLRYQIGRRVARGRAVRIMSAQPGRAAKRAVDRLPHSRRIYDPSGTPGARRADPAARDW